MERKEKRAFPPCTIHSSVHPPGASYGDKTRSRHQRCGVEAAKEGTGRGCGRIALSLSPSPLSLHVGPLLSFAQSVALALSFLRRRRMKKKTSRSPTLALSSLNNAHGDKVHLSCSTFSGQREYERARKREGGREGKGGVLPLALLLRTTGVASLARGSFDAPSIEETKKRLSLPTHHVHAPVLVDDGSVRIVDPASIGRRQVERGPLRAARGLLPPLGLRRREHCFECSTPATRRRCFCALLLRCGPAACAVTRSWPRSLRAWGVKRPLRAEGCVAVLSIARASEANES